MQAYSGEERPASEMAIIRSGGFFPFKNIYITAVDGKKLGLKDTRVAVFRESTRSMSTFLLPIYYMSSRFPLMGP